MKKQSGSDAHGRRLWSLLAISTMVILSMAAGDTEATRYKDLGHRIICMCDSEPVTWAGRRGCQQLLLECNHFNCDVSPRMRRELSAALQKGDSDEAILHSFVQQYGSMVLPTPSMRGINKLFWIVPFAFALVVIAYLVIVFVRKRLRPAMPTTSVPELPHADLDELRSRVRRDTEKDDWS